MVKILIVEDEEPISKLIMMSLKKAGYSCTCAFDGEEAADIIEKEHFDLILLDIMLPKINGYELIEYIKNDNTAVIFITAMGTVNNKVKGLKLGADDYISKPFEIVELIARVESVLRRYNKDKKTIKFLDIEINIHNRIVKKNEVEIILTLKEFNLLILFARNKNIALCRDVIYENVWDNPYLGDSRTIDLHVQRLRKKLGLEECIKSVYKIGYRLEI